MTHRRPDARTLLFRLALFCAVSACTGGRNPPPPSGLSDSVGLIEPAQAARIASLVGAVEEKHFLSIYVRIAAGAPPRSQAPLLPKTETESVVIQIYPATGTYRFERFTAGGAADRIPVSWEETLRRGIEAALSQPQRLGDAVEISLKELSALLGGVAQSTPSDAASTAAPSTSPEDVVRIRRKKNEPFLKTSLAPNSGLLEEPETLYRAYLAVASAGDARTDLALYTAETRALLKGNPPAPADLRRIAEKYRGAPYEVAILEERAVVHFPELDLTYVPFFMVKSEGAWRLDLAASARLVETSARKLWSFRATVKSDNPYLFAFEPHFIDETGHVRYRKRPR